MFFNSYYDTKQSKIHIWEQIKGKRFYDSFTFVPFCFEYDDDGNIKTIDNRKARRVSFGNYHNYYSTVKANDTLLEDNVRPEIQFLSERYYTFEDDSMEIPPLKVYSMDIEVYCEKGFPHVEEAENPIVCISVHDMSENKTTTFGLKQYTGEYAGQSFLSYVQCKDEDELLKRFFLLFQRFPCDVITGWNVMGFDIPYIINRTKKIFGEGTDVYRRFSPIGIVRQWTSKEGDMVTDIAGITILDYHDLYKWYSPNKLESYTLGFVSNFELEKSKVDYSEYDDLNELYRENYNKFIKYNIIDTLRPAQLELKLGYIRLVQALSLLCKAPMKYYNSMTQLIEGLLLTYYRRNNMCAPHHFGGHQEPFDAAYVKEPQKGRYEWVVDLDIISSYPTAIYTLNMSTETYYGRITGMTEQEVMHFTKQRKFPSFDMVGSKGRMKFEGNKLDTFNKALEKKLLCVAPCGSVFVTRPVGVIAKIIENVFSKRKQVKGKRDKIKRSLSELRDDNKVKAEERVKQLDSYQNALKIILNAVFGITSVPYSRYFNKNIAEAIVSCGRQTRAAGEEYVNELMNQPTDDLMGVIEQIKREVKESG